MMGKLFCCVCVAILFAACEPTDKDIFNTERVKVKANIDKVGPFILLGDTLNINFTVPDTLAGNNQTVAVQTLQKAQFFMRFEKLDTATGRVTLAQQSEYWVTKGRIDPINSFSFESTTNQKPFGLTIHFKPSQKGLYYIEVVAQAGQMKVNNSYEPRLVVDFNVPDRHINLAAPYAGSAWANEGMTREFGVFVFWVN